MSPTSFPGVAVIFSTPITNAKRPRPAPMKSRAPCTAAEPDAQAFSNRVIGLKRRSGTCCSAGDAADQRLDVGVFQPAEWRMRPADDAGFGHGFDLLVWWGGE